MRSLLLFLAQICCLALVFGSSKRHRRRRGTKHSSLSHKKKLKDKLRLKLVLPPKEESEKKAENDDDDDEKTNHELVDFKIAKGFLRKNCSSTFKRPVIKAFYKVDQKKQNLLELRPDSVFESKQDVTKRDVIKRIIHVKRGASATNVTYEWRQELSFPTKNFSEIDGMLGKMANICTPFYMDLSLPFGQSYLSLRELVRRAAIYRHSVLRHRDPIFSDEKAFPKKIRKMANREQVNIFSRYYYSHGWDKYSMIPKDYTQFASMQAHAEYRALSALKVIKYLRETPPKSIIESPLRDSPFGFPESDFREHFDKPDKTNAALFRELLCIEVRERYFKVSKEYKVAARSFEEHIIFPSQKLLPDTFIKALFPQTIGNKPAKVKRQSKPLFNFYLTCNTDDPNTKNLLECCQKLSNGIKELRTHKSSTKTNGLFAPKPALKVFKSLVNILIMTYRIKKDIREQDNLIEMPFSTRPLLISQHSRLEQGFFIKRKDYLSCQKEAMRVYLGIRLKQLFATNLLFVDSSDYFLFSLEPLNTTSTPLKLLWKYWHQATLQYGQGTFGSFENHSVKYYFHSGKWHFLTKGKVNTTTVATKSLSLTAMPFHELALFGHQ